MGRRRTPHVRVQLFHATRPGDDDGIFRDYITEIRVDDHRVDTFAETYAKEHGVAVLKSTEEGRALSVTHPDGEFEYLGY